MIKMRINLLKIRSHGFYIRCFLLSTIIVLLTLSDNLKDTHADSNFTQYPDQDRSKIDWQKVSHDPEEWFNLHSWIDENNRKEKYYWWQEFKRDMLHRDIIGRVLACEGECRIYRGKNFSHAKYRTILLEGDEVETGKDSYIWIFMSEGTMLRMSPYSAIALNEIDVGKKKNFLFLRLHHGLVYLSARTANQFEETNKPETDAIFLPLKLKEANPLENDSGNNSILGSILDEDQSASKQWQRLNYLIKKNHQFFTRPTYTLLVLPNGTISGEEMQIMALVNFNGPSFIKHYGIQLKNNQDKSPSSERSADSDDNDNKIGNENADNKTALQFSYRGYSTSQDFSLQQNRWYKVATNGKTIEEFPEGQKLFGLSEFLVRRISTILVARELMLEKYSKCWFQKNISYNDWIRKCGHRQWDVHDKLSLEKRILFLKYYTQKVETANLSAVRNLEKNKKILLSENEKADSSNKIEKTESADKNNATENMDEQDNNHKKSEDQKTGVKEETNDEKFERVWKEKKLKVREEKIKNATQEILEVIEKNATSKKDYTKEVVSKEDAIKDDDDKDDDNKAKEQASEKYEDRLGQIINDMNFDIDLDDKNEMNDDNNNFEYDNRYYKKAISKYIDSITKRRQDND